MVDDNSIINILTENGIDKNILNKENKTAEKVKIKNTRLNYNTNNNNRIQVSKNKELNIKKENKNCLEKQINTRKKNITEENINRTRKENYLNKKSSGNSSKSMISSKSGNKKKIKTNTIQEITKNNKKNSINFNNDIEQPYNDDIIVIEKDYNKNNKYNYNELNKKFSEFERTIKIDWNLTKNNINKNKEKEEEKYLNYIYNYNYIERKDNLGREQDLCNIEDNNSLYINNFSEKDLKKVNKKTFNNSINNNNNKLSQKQIINDKGKNLIKNNNNNKFNNNSKNNCLVNSFGSIGYNPCSSGEFSIKSEKTNSKNPSNIISTKIGMSQSQNNDESKMITIHNNDNFIDFNDCNDSNEKDNINPFHALSGNFKKEQNITNNNSPKRKTETSKTMNRNILTSNKIKINEENNINIKSSNMESSLITQSRLKSSHKKNYPLIEFLSQINLLKYLNNLDNNGFDDIYLLIEEAKKGDIIKDQELKETGIKIPGDRAKILIRIKEKANLFGFSVPKSVYYTLTNFNNIENDQHIIDLKNWLSNIKVDKYLMNFINNGYHSIELLLMQMETENPLTTQILRDEIGIEKIGYRSRILNKLKEEAKSLNNKLKTSVLIINNRGDDKNCDCIIF